MTHIDWLEGHGELAPGAGLGTELEVQSESNIHLSGAARGCKWHAGSIFMFIAHAALLALSLFLHPLQECHPDGVLT